MRTRKRTIALFFAPFCVQAAALLTFVRGGSTPVEAAVDAMFAVLPFAAFAAFWASLGVRIGVLERDWLGALHGLCFASVTIPPFALLGVFAAAASGGSVLTAVFASTMFVPYLAAALGILAHAISSMTDVAWKLAAAALIIQAAAYAALVMLI